MVNLDPYFEINNENIFYFQYKGKIIIFKRNLTYTAPLNLNILIDPVDEGDTGNDDIEDTQLDDSLSSVRTSASLLVRNIHQELDLDADVEVIQGTGKLLLTNARAGLWISNMSRYRQTSFSHIC